MIVALFFRTVHAITTALAFARRRSIMVTGDRR